MAPYPKESYIKQARLKLEKAGIEHQEFNNGIHFKIGKIDFWPTTGKWMDGVDEGRGIQELIKRINPPVSKVKKLSVEQIFQIAVKSKDRSLEGICVSIHTEIYGK